MTSLAALVLPPPFKEGHYETYLKELEIWQLMKSCTAEEQGPVVFRTLNGRAKVAALELSPQEIGSTNGLALIIQKLDKIFLPEKNLRICNKLDQFESFKRAPNMTMSNFVLDFERLYNQLIEYGCTYPDGVRAYRLMKSANMSPEHEKLLRATVATGKWSYECVKDQLTKIFNDILSVKTNSSPTSYDPPIKVEETYYTKDNDFAQDSYAQCSDYTSFDTLHYENYTDFDSDEPEYVVNNNIPPDYDIYYGANPTKWNSVRPSRPKFSNNRRFNDSPMSQNFQNRKMYTPQSQKHANSPRYNPFSMNPKDFRGNPTVCRKCRSIYHWWQDCPHVTPEEKMNNPKRTYFNQNSSQEDLYIALFQKSTPTTSDEIICLMSETINKAVIDSGCTKTCCGQDWYDAYIQTLSEEDSKNISVQESDAIFRFGDSPPVTSLKKVLLPIYINNVNLLLETEVVPSSVPLLLSKETMIKAKANMKFYEGKIEMFGEEQPMICTSSGHYSIPIVKESDSSSIKTDLVLFTSKSNMNSKEIAKKLHTQFGHPSCEKLNKLVKNSGMENDELTKAIEDISSNCDICKKFKASKPRPAVTFPLASEFNQTVAMDLKTWEKDKTYLFNVIDHATRFAASALIKSKKANIIVGAFFRIWVSIFGVPSKVLSDNGGEFANHEFTDMCQNLSINFQTTAAEAPWSNGLCEKHNGIVGEVMSKIIEDTNCSPEIALCWTIMAKNSLSNVYGFSPYQLVFGKTPKLPNVFDNQLPALEGVSASQLIADHLNALHKARQEFIKLESSEKIRRALRSKTRKHNDIRYLSGDEVFFKRDNEKKWQGPARVIGQDGSKVLVKTPTGLISVHTCRLMLTSDSERNHRELDANSIQYENINQSDSSQQIDEKENFNTSQENSDLISEEINKLTVTSDEITCSLNVPKEKSVIQDPLPNDLPHLLDEPIDDMEDNQKDVITHKNEDTDVTETSLKSFKASDIFNTKDLPKTNSKIKFRQHDTDKWINCIILGRAGKAGGKYEYWINYRDLDSDKSDCINWKEDVDEWELFNEEVYVTTSKEFDDAKKQELDKWKELDVYTEVDNEGQSYITGRWVLNEKEVDKIKVKKARFVARGFQELDEHQSDSPCCNQETTRVVLSVIASKEWNINSLDIKAAFLQGNEIDREIFLKPPKEANSPDKLWRLNRCVYGLQDASRFWFFRVQEELIRLGCKSSKYDPTLYTYYEGELKGILITHVDDFLWSGSVEFFNNVINHLKQTFKISSEKSNSFKYLGTEITKTEDGIYVSQESYLEKLEEIPLSAERKENKLSELTEDEIKALRTAIGQLNWLSIRTRPDLSYDVCYLSTQIKNANIDLILYANKVMKKAKHNTVFLYYPKLELTNLKLRCYADASYGNLPDGGSQGGFYVELNDGIKSAPLDWRSKRLTRTPKNTLAAETISMVEGFESAYLISKLLNEILHQNTSKEIEIEAITDNFSLFEASHTTTAIQDRRLRIELAILREGITRSEFQLKWIDTKNQLSDCFTKKGSDPKKLIAQITGKNVV